MSVNLTAKRSAVQAISVLPAVTRTAAEKRSVEVFPATAKMQKGSFRYMKKVPETAFFVSQNLVLHKMLLFLEQYKNLEKTLIFGRFGSIMVIEW